MIEMKRIIWPEERTARRVGIALAVLASLIAVVGYLSQHTGLDLGQFLSQLIADFYANASTELASIAVTVLIIDRLNQRRETQREKAELILQMSSPDNTFAQEAVRRLRIRGWLKDGSLRGADLRWANLQQGELWSADLQGVDFDQASLKGARLEKANLRGARNLTDEQLALTRNLRRATLPDGKRYDGRFNLAGDFFLARREHVDTDDSVAMAGFYGVSLEEYQRGQE